VHFALHHQIARFALGARLLRFSTKEFLMRGYVFALMSLTALFASPVAAHGPQIQITNDGDKIVTRRLIQDGPYSDSLTPETAAYVIRMQPFNSVWYSRPNNSTHPILGTPTYYSGPGVAYGYDRTTGGAQRFEAGGVFSLHLTNGLERWNGTDFVDAGTTELKAFIGSAVNIVSPPENFAVTSETDSFLQLPAVVDDYDAEVHNTVRYALLGDGSSPTSDSLDGVYLLTLQLSSTQSDLENSDEFQFILHKNASHGALSNAVASLGLSSSQVQWVPEPSALALLLLGTLGVSIARGRGCRAE
jgi:hypothetical protein